MTKSTASTIEINGEIWRPVPGSEQYEVSDLGRVRRGARLLTPYTTNTSRYPRVALSAPSGRKMAYVHHLVLGAFVGPRPEGMETRHLNGVRTDCRLVNLAYGTQAENMADRAAHHAGRYRTAVTA